MPRHTKIRALMIVGKNFPPNRGGLATTMYDLATGLKTEKIVCLTSVEDAVHSEDNKYELYFSKIFNPGMRFAKAADVLKSAALIRGKYKPNIIILDACWTGNVALWFKRVFGWPLIVFAHGGEILKLKTGYWDKPLKTLKASDRVLSNSRYCCRLLEEIGIDKRKTEIVYRGIDTDIYRPLPENDVVDFRKQLSLGDGRIILTVANLYRYKGQDMVIRALPAILRVIPDALYLVVGNGRDEDYLRETAQAAGVMDHVRIFPNVLNREEINRFYNACDLFVMPSREIAEHNQVEGFGIAFVEANACGKPVIGGRSGGIPDAIVEGETGLLVDPMNPQGIADAILTVLGEPALARKFGGQGRERVIRSFTKTMMMERMRQICEELIGNN